METVRKILVPVDLTASARTALETAAMFSSPLGASVTVLHVGSSPGVPWAHALVSVELTAAEFKTLLRSTTDADTSRLLERIERCGRVCSNRRTELSPARAICAVAQEQGTDLIVIAAHRHSRLASWIGGGVSEELVRSAPCAVLVVRAPDRWHRPAATPALFTREV